MESVLRIQIVNIDDVEDHGDAPVGDYGEHQGENIIRDGGDEWLPRGEGV